VTNPSAWIVLIAVIALADTTLANGSYPVKVSYRQTQIMQLLFN